MQLTETIFQPAEATETAAVGAENSVFVNGRFRVHAMTGLRRYAEELISRMDGNLRVLEPGGNLTGLAGHAWEQWALPMRVRAGFLWSPCNTGPIGFGRQVVTIHDMFPLDHPEWFTPNFVRCFRAIVPRLIRRVQGVIAVSEYTKRRIAAAVPEAEDKIAVIHSGIGAQFCPARSNAPAEAARALGLPSRNYLLSVSSIEPRKNVARILTAWERLLPHLPQDLWLVLAGKQGDKGVFASGGAGHVPERVHFTGYVPDDFLPGLYSGAQAFLFPSLAEGFGFPALEAMACGTPVLTSAASSLPEVCGTAAYLVDPCKIHEIALGIIELTSNQDLRTNLRIRGLSRAAKFKWETAANKTWSVLERELCRTASNAHTREAHTREAHV